MYYIIIIIITATEFLSDKTTSIIIILNYLYYYFPENIYVYLMHNWKWIIWNNILVVQSIIFMKFVDCMCFEHCIRPLA